MFTESKYAIVCVPWFMCEPGCGISLKQNMRFTYMEQMIIKKKYVMTEMKHTIAELNCLDFC